MEEDGVGDCAAVGCGGVKAEAICFLAVLTAASAY